MRVVLVGSKNSGKSSIVRALARIDFLPGCSTRKPFVLNLESKPQEGEDQETWAVFSHLPGQRFYDPLDMRKVIEAEMGKEADAEWISEIEFCMTISSLDFSENLTLIDLPGTIEGDEAEAKAIGQLTFKYISKENCVLMAVIPADSDDIRKDDALIMCHVADPKGQRTMAVVTKIDLVINVEDEIGPINVEDKNNPSSKFLRGTTCPFFLGYFGVINSPHQTLSDAREYESNFFNDHLVLNHSFDKCGIPHLAGQLDKLASSVKSAVDKFDKAKNKYYKEEAEGKALSDGGDFLGAENWYREALETLGSLTEYKDTHVHGSFVTLDDPISKLFEVLIKLARCLEFQGKIEDAVTRLREALLFYRNGMSSSEQAKLGYLYNLCESKVEDLSRQLCDKEKEDPDADANKKEEEESVQPCPTTPRTPPVCLICNKRLGPTHFTCICRCGKQFCAVHRPPERHGCDFDYKKEGRAKIERENPVVKASKLDKI